MWKDRKYTYQSFHSVHGDLLMGYLKDMALQGWRFKTFHKNWSIMEFEKTEPQQKYFQWECADSRLKGKQWEEAVEERKEEHWKEGWHYEGEYGDMLIFSANEQLPFQHLGGEYGRLNNVFASLKKTRNWLIGTLLCLILCIAFLSLRLFVTEIGDDYLEYGLKGAFCLLEGYSGLILAGIMIIILGFVFVELLLFPRIGKEKSKAEKLLQESGVLTYGVWDKYLKEKKRGGIAALAVIIIGLIGLLGFFVSIAVEEGANGFIVFTISIVLMLVGLFAVHNAAEKGRWRFGKKVLLGGGVFLVLICIEVGLIFGMSTLVDTSKGRTAEELSDNKVGKKEITYPPSLFHIEDLSDTGYFYESKKNFLGSYESFDLYGGEIDANYQYYRYEVKNQKFYEILQKQALENMEPCDPERIAEVPKGMTVYRVEWDEETAEWFYGDSLLIFKGKEILLLNVNLYGFTIEEILENLVSKQSL